MDKSNYCPVSNLSFVPKVAEQDEAIRLDEYLTANDLLLHFQSAYQKRHSTETAMLRVWSDILMSVIPIRQFLELLMSDI